MESIEDYKPPEEDLHIAGLTEKSLSDISLYRGWERRYRRLEAAEPK
jgi:hypothetical protein